MSKARKNITLYPDIVTIGNKLCNDRNRNFSMLVSELIREEWERRMAKNK
jgi:hypothetical protein